ncbi:MAG: hypothetical protein RL341_467 [Pseudomonadota bacterium]|jgi:hypothetical protein
MDIACLLLSEMKTPFALSLSKRICYLSAWVNRLRMGFDGLSPNGC